MSDTTNSDSGFRVICEDGVSRHLADFATRTEAEHFAEWGHACTTTHIVSEIRSERRRIAGAVDGLLVAMAKMFSDPMFAIDAGCHFTCSEAENVANVLRALGFDAEAALWLYGHSESDDEDDAHYQMEDPS